MEQPIKHTLPKLNYQYSDLEPHIDATTVELHYSKHHQGYVDGLNKAEEALAKCRETGDFSNVKHLKREIAFHGSGHILHSLYWANMCAAKDAKGKPSGNLLAAIELKYGSSYFVMNGIDIKIYCREKVKKIVKGKDRYGHEEIDYEPTGILVFQTTVSGTREWEDSSLKIEEKIDKMIEYCEFHSKRLKDCHDKQRRKSRKEELVRWLKLKQQQKDKEKYK